MIKQAKFCSDFLSSLNFGQVSDIQTDRQSDIQTKYSAHEPTGSKIGATIRPVLLK